MTGARRDLTTTRGYQPRADLAVPDTPTELEPVRLRAQLEVVRAQIAPEANDAELDFFAQVCARFQLSPFADQIALVGRYSRDAGRKVHRHQITVAGRRALAVRSGELVGIEGPVWCGPRDKNGGELVWHEVWDDEQDHPYCARVLVHRRGWIKPANGTAKWSEFAVYFNQKLGDLWAKMPSHMLGKTAESLALRRAFPEIFTPDVLGAYHGEIADEWGDQLEADGGHVEIVDAPPPADPKTGEIIMDSGVVIEVSDAGPAASDVSEAGEAPSPTQPAGPDISSDAAARSQLIGAQCVASGLTKHEDRCLFLEAFSQGRYTSTFDVPADEVAQVQATLVRLKRGVLRLDTRDGVPVLISAATQAPTTDPSGQHSRRRDRTAP